MSGSRDILYSTNNDVAIITLNRPSLLNAITHDMMRQFRAALTQAGVDKARALVITGSGRAFSSGGDLANRNDDDDISDMMKTIWNPAMQQLAALPMPVLAAVNGVAAGAGCSLALAADFMMMERSAYLSLSFIKVGLVADAGATWHLTQALGRHRATRLLMLSEKISAQSAFEWGLAQQVVDDGAVVESGMELASQLAAGPTAAYAMTKKSIRTALEGTFLESLEEERVLQSLAGETSDFKEALSAFRQKRKPRFTGT